jgi:hypothetical protein
MTWKEVEVLPVGALLLRRGDAVDSFALVMKPYQNGKITVAYQMYGHYKQYDEEEEPLSRELFIQEISQNVHRLQLPGLKRHPSHPLDAWRRVA